MSRAAAVRESQPYSGFREGDWPPTLDRSGPPGCALGPDSLLLRDIPVVVPGAWPITRPFCTVPTAPAPPFTAVPEFSGIVAPASLPPAWGQRACKRQCCCERCGFKVHGHYIPCRKRETSQVSLWLNLCVSQFGDLGYCRQLLSATTSNRWDCGRQTVSAA